MSLLEDVVRMEPGAFPLRRRSMINVVEPVVEPQVERKQPNPVIEQE